jgi:ribonuclease P protein component
MAKQSFTKASRLLGSSQYSSVFSQARFRLSAKNLLILAKTSEGPARLGLVVGKKHVRSAVQRNRIKRLIRESFRIRKQEFGTIDLVVLARSGLDMLSNQQITVQANLLFDELTKKLN